MIRTVTGISFKNLQNIVTEFGGKKFYAKQIWKWIYQRSVTDFDRMTDLPLDLRSTLGSYFTPDKITVREIRKSFDGTEKLLLELSDGIYIECVVIPEKNRLTLCVSSQAGCRFNCSFCATGRMGFIRDLTSSEIVSQVLTASNHTRRRITNVVFMGMGEPFDNYDQVLRAADIISDDSGLGIGKRKITISSFGHIEGIRKYIEEDIRYKLAISLHNPFDDQRSRIMPVNKKYPVKELFDILKIYTEKSNRKVIFEYVLIKGVNDSKEHAAELMKRLKRMPCKLNLIRYHKCPDELDLDPPDKNSEFNFMAKLKDAPFPVVFRKSRGEDISGACGQLAGGKINR
ncbi:MAG: 23S rRNA (adenine(2503)-C(2))-methyltransferase RlmN [Candidatus Delongbacteria bacterium]